MCNLHRQRKLVTYKKPAEPGLPSLIPRPHPQEGKGLGTLERFLGHVHHHVTARAPIQIYANNHDH